MNSQNETDLHSSFEAPTNHIYLITDRHCNWPNMANSNFCVTDRGCFVHLERANISNEFAMNVKKKKILKEKSPLRLFDA